MIRNLNNIKKPYQVSSNQTVGLEYYWKFNDSPTDEVQALDANLYGTATYSTSPETKGLLVDGTLGSYADFTDYLTAKTEFSVSFLFKKPAGDSVLLNNWNAASNARSLLVRLRSNKIQAYMNINSATFGGDISNFTNYNNWNQLTLTLKDGSFKRYLNGVLRSTITTNGGDIDGSFVYPLLLGLSNEGYQSGEYDLLGFWSRELSATEVTDNYNLEIAGTPLI